MNLNLEPVSTDVIDARGINDAIVIDSATLTDMVHMAANGGYMQGVHDALICGAFGIGIMLALAFLVYACRDMGKARKRRASYAWRCRQAVMSTSNPYAAAVLKGEF